MVSLCLMDAVEKQIKEMLVLLNEEYSNDLRPCQYFNLFCGTSTGAYVHGLPHLSSRIIDAP
jgi:hypothetical protein